MRGESGRERREEIRNLAGGAHATVGLVVGVHERIADVVEVDSIVCFIVDGKY